MRAAGGWSEPREVRVTFQRVAAPEQIVDHIASNSWMAALPGEERASTMDRVRSLIEHGHTPREMPLHVVIGLALLA